jgi:hypothetical protein
MSEPISARTGARIAWRAQRAVQGSGGADLRREDSGYVYIAVPIKTQRSCPFWVTAYEVCCKSVLG